MVAERDARTRCVARTQSGKQCKNYALAGSSYCWVHQPADEMGYEADLAKEGLEQATIDWEQVVTAKLDQASFSPMALFDLIRDNRNKFSPEALSRILEKLRETVGEDFFDVDTWKGVWYMLNYSLEYQADNLKRRMSGDYETDEWGLDQDVVNAAEPILNSMYRKYWRVESTGIENIPDEGRVLLVANHSGQLPWDGVMIAAAVYNEHPSQRIVRSLYGSGFSSLPFTSALRSKLGQVLATEQNGTRLLEQEHVVAVFPEGYQGLGKLFKQRYRLARFGRGEFIRMALKTQAPIIPVAVVGAEETYLSLHNSETIARLLGVPYFSISPTFPWLGLFGFVPLPTKWFIDFGEPIPMDIYGPEAEDNLLLVAELTDQVRDVVQKMLYKRLAGRKSIFFG